MTQYYYHPESDCYWVSEKDLGGDFHDGQSFEVTADEYERGRHSRMVILPDRTPPLDDEKDHFLVTSHSIDGTFESCPRRFEFLHGYLRAPEFESDAYAADVGTAMHEGMQACQRALARGATREWAEELGNIELLRHWPWEVEERRRKESKPVGQRTLGNALLLLQTIYNLPEWREWDLVQIEGYGPAIEVPWRIVHKSLGKIPLPYNRFGYVVTQGKIDFIFRNRTTGKYRIWDLKTTAKAKPAHDAAFRFSGQAGQYGIVLEHALGLDWRKGLEVTYLMCVFGNDSNTDLSVYPLNYSLDGEEMEDSIRVKMDRLDRMVKYAREGYFPRRAHGCDFYGNPCGFLDICQRRDTKFIESWFAFEIAKGTFRTHERLYDPVWTLEA